MFESMEPRLFLSAVGFAQVKPAKKVTARLPVLFKQKSLTTTATKKTNKSSVKPSAYGLGSPYGGITPAQMVGAYLGTNFNFYGVTGDGTGETIAIIDAYDDPGLVSSTASNFATSDLAKFDAFYHLPNPPSFTKYGVSNNQVSTTLPGVDPNGPYSGGSITWEIEESLDVEWAHVMAPNASIVLIEAPTNAMNNLFHAVVAADQLPAVNVVSMSFGQDESLTTQQGLFDSDMNVSSGVTYLAAAGDEGAYGSSAGEAGTVAPQYPADSPLAVAVGGTSLSASGISWSSESTWGNSISSGSIGGGGGGIAINYNTPSYQTTLLGSSTNRQYPDISLDGNYNTGVPIYDSYDFGSATPWVNGTVGGTSLATPLMAGIVAVADQGRALDGLQPLNSDGHSGGVDIHTLLYGFAGTGSSYNPHSDFHDITTGNAIGPTGYGPTAGYDLASGLGSPVAGNLVFDLSGISSTPAASQPAITSLYLKPDTTAGLTDVWVNSSTPGTGTPTYKFVAADIASYSDRGGSEAFTVVLVTTTVTGASSTLSIPAPSGTAFAVGSSYISGDSYVSFGTTTIHFTGVTTLNLSPAAASNSLTVNGTPSGNDTFAVTTSSITLNSLLINLTNLTNPTLSPGIGTDVLNVSSGTVTIAGPAAGAGILIRNFSNISIAANGTALFSTGSLHTDRMLVQTTTLSVVGQLDLGGNDLIVHNGNLTAITALLATGYANGLWNGKGIASAAANANTSHLTALGAIQNTLYGGSGQPQFDGVSPISTDVLIKYTYYGDSNLDGKVDGSDYARIDNAFVSGLTGWFNGNFNYDGAVNGSDYTLIDSVFNMQS